MLRDTQYEHVHEEATLKQEHTHRLTAETLEQAALQHERLACDALFDEDAATLLEDATELRAKSRAHLEMAELSAEGPIEPQTASIGPMLTAAALGTALAVPGGVTLGAAGVAVAPYLGIDPRGTAMQRVRACLRRDATGTTPAIDP